MRLLWLNVVENVVTSFPLSFPENEKVLENQRFSRTLDGGDKRDRTADLLNAIDFSQGVPPKIC